MGATELEIKIDHSRDELLTDFGKTTLKKQYCLEGEGYQDAFARAAKAFSGGDQALAQRLYDYASQLHFAFATPLLANGGTNRGLPISCFLNYVHDSIHGLADNFRENAFLSTNGGGIGTYWGHVRSVGETTSRGVDTPGVMPFMHVQDAQMLAYHQGATRRGAAATYLDISHPEILEFINMRSSSGGDVHRKNENLHHGVNITDAFMEAVVDNGEWQLIDPHSRRVHQTVKARDLWISILTARLNFGEPYLFFIDTANRHLPSLMQDKGLYIHHSNLCTEITLPTAPDRTAVCCLSSINIAKMNEWWPNREQFVADLVTMLDNVLDVFCEVAPEPMWRAVKSAMEERSIGLGTLGFHTYLQQNGIPMASEEATLINKDIYKNIKLLAQKASRDLAVSRGEPEDIKGSGYRHAHLMAIAPNASSSIICGGVSPSVEPMAANAFTQKTKSGSHAVRNPVLVKLLQERGQDNDEVWESINLHSGSVQHLDFLTEEEKSVFLTAQETDPMTIVQLAADRQHYICQAQSVNLFFPSDASRKDLHNTHLAAWKLGLKSLYYVRSSSIKTTNAGLLPSILKEKEAAERPEGYTETAVAAETPGFCTMESECKSCEG